MSRSRTDRIVEISLGLTAFLSGSIVLLILWFLLEGALPTFRDGHFVDLFTDGKWQPGSRRDPQYGIGPMLLGSLTVTVLSTAIAAPLGIAGAIFHRFHVPAMVAKWNHRLLELLAGVPSVVFGFWALTVLVPIINRIHPPGQSLLAAALVLALMILPTVALTSQVALAAIPLGQLQAAAALGLGKARTIWCIALPAARRGITGGLLLALARAVGETMAVVMVCGNISQIPHSIFDPIRPVTATIALEMGYATASHKALLYTAGLILVLCTGGLMCWQLFRKDREEADEQALNA